MLLNIIKDQDFFGAKVSLNFNQKSSHNTLIGGIVSCKIKIMMFSYVLLLFKQLIFFEKDKNSSISKIIEIHELPEVLLNETSFTPMFNFDDAITGGIEL